MTQYGVEHDLAQSPFRTRLMYGQASIGQGGIDFCFSSRTSMARFEDGLEKNREELRSSLSNRFKIKFKLSDAFCDIQLYRRCERRGFLIYMDGDEVQWIGQLEYDGQRVCRQTLQEK